MTTIVTGSEPPYILSIYVYLPHLAVHDDEIFRP